MEIKGLTEREVALKKSQGKINIVPQAPSRTIGGIIKANVFTIFNALNLGLAIVVIIAGSFINATFGFLIIINALIGIIQELKAKKIIDKLSVLNRSKVSVLRDGISIKIDSAEIVEEDVIYISAGEQIPADAELLQESELEVDEALLTGESEPVLKRYGEKLLAGSFVVSGGAYAKVIKVGGDTYAANLSKEAKKFKKINSMIQRDINKIFRVITWIVIPSSIVLVTTQLVFTNRSWREAVLGAVSGVIGMVPEGLVLLTSATLIVAIIRVSKWNALVQELPATEVLAMVDTLCLDKTGTITEGILRVTEIAVLSDNREEEIVAILKKIVTSMGSYNPTDNAMTEIFKEQYKREFDLTEGVKIEQVIPFSSKRKWSGISLENNDSYILGAPDIILGDKYDILKERVDIEAEKGNRIILLAKRSGPIVNYNIANDIEGIALIILEDVIRAEAKEVIDYFYREGVDLKIISGDNPVTVASIAKKVDIKDAHKYVDASKLPDDIEELAKMVEDIKVFGRVTPHKKKNIIKALQWNKHIVAMTGDGVNDVLALKESDCGIAMANGAQAAKAVSQIVLMDSNFNALPEIVLEGRRSINNLKRVAELFLTKTVYSVILSIIFALICKPFPLIPIQVGLIGATTIGIPAFFLALAPNKEKLEKGFLNTILKKAIPNGIVMALCTIFIYLFATICGLSLKECRTLAVATLEVISIMILVKVASPMNKYKIILVVSMVGLFILSFSTSIGRYIYRLKVPPHKYCFLVLIIAVASVPLINIVRKLLNKHLCKIDI